MTIKPEVVQKLDSVDGIAELRQVGREGRREG